MSTVKNMKKTNKNKDADKVTLSVQVEREVADEFQTRAKSADSDASKVLRKLIRSHLAKEAA